MAPGVRKPPKRLLALSGAVIVLAIAGIVAIVTHHRDLGRSLIGLCVVLSPFSLILARRLSTPPASGPETTTRQ